MAFYLYAGLSNLSVRYAQFLIGLSKRVLHQCLFPFFFVNFSFCNTHCLMIQINRTKKNLKTGSESGSFGTFGTGLGGLLHGVVFTFGVTISDDESCDGY